MKITQRLWQSYLQQKSISADVFIPGTVILIVTNRCNFSCRHCLRQSSRPEDLSLEIAEKILRDAQRFGFTHIALTGGEPLVYPHLKQLIERIVYHGYKFSLVTNGYLFNDWVPFFKTVRSHMSFIGFSVESALPKTHDAIRHPGSWDKLLEAFSRCRQERLPFRFVTAISQANYNEIFDIALYAKRKGAHGLTATTVLPCPNSQNNNLVLSAQQREKLYGALVSLGRTLRFPIYIGADIRAQRNIKLCFALNMAETTINAGGRLVQCCEVANFDDPDIERRAIIADLNAQDFAQAMKNLSQYIDRFLRSRIDAYAQNGNDTRHIDFNSCFYCMKQLKKT